MNLTGTYDHGEAQQGQIAIIAPANPANLFPGLVGYPLPHGNRDVDFTTGVNYHQKNRQFMGVLRADYDVSSDITLTSLTNYIDTKIYSPRDFDGIFFPLTSGFTGGTIKSFG